MSVSSDRAYHDRMDDYRMGPAELCLSIAFAFVAIGAIYANC